MQPPAHVDARAAQAIELGHQSRGIDHHARPNDRMLAGAQDAAGNQLQDKTAAVENDGVAGIVAAGAARDVIEGSRHVIDDFALAFISPLRAHHYDRFHPRCRSLSICHSGRTLPEKSRNFAKRRKLIVLLTFAARFIREAARGLRRNEYRTRGARLNARRGMRSLAGQFPSITASASSRTFSSTPLLLRAGSGVKGGPTVFVGPFIARPLTLRTARYHGVWTKRSFVLARDSFAASDQDSSL